MSKVVIENGVLSYRKLLQQVQVPLSEVVWGYLQIQDVETSMCCGRYSAQLSRVIFRERSGKQHFFEYEEKNKARALLKEMEEKNPSMAVGYTEENKARFLA